MKKLNNNAISEVIGSNLLLLITVATFSIIYISAFALLSTDAADTSSDIIVQVEGNNIIFSHMGGDSLPLETAITLRNNLGFNQQFLLNEQLSETAKSDGFWNMGEQLVYSSQELTGSSLEVKILDTTHNSLILSTILPASNPIITYINSIYPSIQTSSPITITATSTGVTPDNVSLYYQWRGYWEDTFENDDALVSTYHNMSFDQGDYVIVNRSGEGSEFTEYVDTQNTAIDGINDIGSHSDFSAQQTSPDNIYDTFQEENTAPSGNLLSDGFEETPWDSNWDENGATSWEQSSDEHYTGSYAAYSNYYNKGDLISDDLNTSDASGIKIDFWYRLDGEIEWEDVVLYYYDGSNWDFIAYLGGENEGQWIHYTDIITDSQYFDSNFKIRFIGDQSYYGEEIWIDNINITKLSVLFTDGFEGSPWDDNWDDTSSDWFESSYSHSGSHSAGSWNNEEGYFTSNNIDTSSVTDTMIIDFWYMLEYTESSDLSLYYYDGSNWDWIAYLGDGIEGTWLHYTDTITSPEYFRSNFRIRFNSNLQGGYWSERVWVDDIQIFTELPGNTNYELMLEEQWNNLEYSLDNEMLCIKTGSFSGETLSVDVWNTSLSNWETLTTLTANTWNNISVSSWLTSQTFTIRFQAGTETSDASQDTWEIDTALLHLWTPGQSIYYEGNITSIQFTKQGSTGWDQFFATVNNTADSTFSILNSVGTPLLTGLTGNGDDISSISEDTIYLFGEFTGPVQLDDWKVTRELSDWTLYEIDTTDSEWGWEFTFIDNGDYWFYSVGDKDGWMTELPPDAPAYDTSCKYES